MPMFSHDKAIGLALRAARRALPGLARSSGLLGLIAWLRQRQAVSVLMYHRVLPTTGRDTFSSPGIIVDTHTFEEQMRYLRRHCHPISLAELRDVLVGHRRPQPSSCLVTFDDGWHDNFQHAYPILKKYRVPAVFFVATDYIGTDRCFWQEQVSRQLYDAWHDKKPSTDIMQSLGLGLHSGMSDSHIRGEIRMLIESRKSLPADELQEWIQSVSAFTGATQRSDGKSGDDRFMSWQQVAQLSHEGLVTIGSHACSHRPLSGLTASEQAEELRHSRGDLQSRLGIPVLAVAYPNGDFNDDTISAASGCGYDMGFTTLQGLNTPGSNPLTIKRVNVHEASSSTRTDFMCRLASLPI